MESGYSIDHMADDLALAMKRLGLSKVHMIAVSQGGMIAQVLAKRYPELVSRLALVTMADKVNDTMKQTVEGWINLAELGRNKELFLDMMAKTFSDS
ncbi:alpha/beta fold hydrolase [Streptococcus rupicaprae]